MTDSCEGNWRARRVCWPRRRGGSAGGQGLGGRHGSRGTGSGHTAGTSGQQPAPPALAGAWAAREGLQPLGSWAGGRQGGPPPSPRAGRPSGWGTGVGTRALGTGRQGLPLGYRVGTQAAGTQGTACPVGAGRAQAGVRGTQGSRRVGQAPGTQGAYPPAPPFDRTVKRLPHPAAFGTWIFTRDPAQGLFCTSNKREKEIDVSGISQRERERRDRLYERGLKQCNTCEEPLPLDKFSPRSDGYKRLNGTCRDCKNLHAADYRQRTPEYQAARQKRWRQGNPKSWLAISRRRDARVRWRQTGVAV